VPTQLVLGEPAAASAATIQVTVNGVRRSAEVIAR
jgi:hypothetical protein